MIMTAFLCENNTRYHKYLTLTCNICNNLYTKQILQNIFNFLR